MKKVTEFLIFILKWDIRISFIVFAVIILWYFLQNYYKESTDTRKIVKF